MPLLFLIQPVAAILEYFCSEASLSLKDSCNGTSCLLYPGSGRRRRGSQSEDSTNRYEVEALRKEGRPEGHLRFANGSSSSHSDRLSGVFLAHGIRPPSIKAEFEDLEPQIQFLYSTRFFRSLMWVIQISILVLSLVALTMGTIYLVPGTSDSVVTDGTFLVNLQGGGVASVTAALVWGYGTVSVYVLSGSFFSKAFK